jgi:hypothetical protein
MPQVDVAPTWNDSLLQHQQQHTVSKAVSTDPLHVQDADVQTTDRCDAGCQASTSGRTSSAGQRSRADPHLRTFLQHVGPAMFAALCSNSKAAAGSAGRVASQAGQQEVGDLKDMGTQDGSVPCMRSAAHDGDVRPRHLRTTACSATMLNSDGQAILCCLTAVPPAPRIAPPHCCTRSSGTANSTAPWCVHPLQEPARCIMQLTAFSSSSILSSSNLSGSQSSSSSSRGTLGRANPHKLQVTSLSWSKSGQTLAASFGR